jgi:hypothetical protein
MLAPRASDETALESRWRAESDLACPSERGVPLIQRQYLGGVRTEPLRAGQALDCENK